MEELPIEYNNWFWCVLKHHTHARATMTTAKTWTKYQELNTNYTVHIIFSIKSGSYFSVLNFTYFALYYRCKMIYVKFPYTWLQLEFTQLWKEIVYDILLGPSSKTSDMYYASLKQQSIIIGKRHRWMTSGGKCIQYHQVTIPHACLSD